jgi:DNA polymerase-3 subunit alpha
MQIAQVMAGYSLAEADLLRRAMGKKKKEIMEEQRAIFIERAVAHDTDRRVAEEVFDTMARFAEYGFNKSHAAAYSLLAYRAAYLKAHYPAVYMAAVLTHHADNSEDVGFFLQEVRACGIEVLPPCVNASEVRFSVPSLTQIRFGLGGIKHLGEKMAQLIVAEREQGGSFRDVFDFAVRMIQRGLNKKAFESLCFAGALDSLVGGQREYLLDEINRQLILEHATTRSKPIAVVQASLFDVREVAPPQPPTLRSPARRLSLPERLRQEREYIGYFLSSHPLDEYRSTIDAAKLRTEASLVLNAEQPEERLVRCAALLMDVDERRSRQGRPYARLAFEDKVGNFQLTVFSPQWEQWAPKVQGRIGEPFFLEAEYTLRPEGTPEWKLRILDELQAAFQTLLPALCLEWDLAHLSAPDHLVELQDRVKQLQGTIPVLLLLHHKGEYPVLLQTDWKLRYVPAMEEHLRPLGIRLRTDIPL